MKHTLEELLTALKDENVEIVGSENSGFNKPSSLKNAQTGDLCFCRKTDASAMETTINSPASIIIVPVDMPIRNNNCAGDKTIIKVKNPRLAFIHSVRSIFEPEKPKGIDSSAIISNDAKIDHSAYIGPHSVIGAANIGARTVVSAGTIIFDGITIGSNVLIGSGTVIGGDGFGFERDESGKLVKFPHIGGVVIEDDVEIGSNTSIDRGTLDATILKRGCKIDNLVHIAHNVIVGEHATVIAQAMIGGGVLIGDRAWIAPGACIMNQIRIGDDAVVGLGAVVVKDVEQGQTVMGSPAKDAELFRKLQKCLKKLTDSGVETY